MYAVTTLPLLAVLLALLANMRGLPLYALMVASALGFALVTLATRIFGLAETSTGVTGNFAAPAILLIMLSAVHFMQHRSTAPLSPKTATVAFWALLGALLAPGMALEIAGAFDPNLVGAVSDMMGFVVLVVLTCILLLFALPVIALVKARNQDS